jgi:hypothetical protein
MSVFQKHSRQVTHIVDSRNEPKFVSSDTQFRSLYIYVIFSPTKFSVLPWTWRHNLHRKRWYPHTILHGVMILKTEIWIRIKCFWVYVSPLERLVRSELSIWYEVLKQELLWYRNVKWWATSFVMVNQTLVTVSNFPIDVRCRTAVKSARKHSVDMSPCRSEFWSASKRLEREEKRNF